MHDPASSPQPAPAPSALASSSLPLSPASIIAVVGSLLAIISFFALSYYGLSFGGVSTSITGRDLATVSTADLTVESYALLWLVPLAGLVALVMGLLPLGLRTISQRTTGIISVVAGAVGLVTLIITYVRINGEVSSSASASAQTGVSYGFGIGFWLSVIGMLAVIVAGALSLRSSQA